MPYSSRRISVVLAAVLAAACSDTTDPDPTPGPDTGPISGITVSNPVTLAGVRAAFVSVPPGTAPGATQVTVTNRRTLQVIPASMVDGGLDPVAIPAAAHDTLEVMIRLAGGVSVVARELVPVRRAPRVVRTGPAGGGRGVALNAVVSVIFSEPIDAATLGAGSIKLLRSAAQVEGIVRPSAASPVGAEFAPSAALLPASEYQLVISDQLHDLTGDPLERPITAKFETWKPFTGPGTPRSYLHFSTPPRTLRNGGLFDPAIVVTVLDAASSNRVHSYNGPVLLTGASLAGTSPEGALIGQTTVNAQNGVAVFPNIGIDGTGDTYFALTASAADMQLIQSDPFFVQDRDSPWVRKAPFGPMDRIGPVPAIVNGTVYVIGGYSSDWDDYVTFFATVEAHNPALNTWTAKTPMPTRRAYHAAGVVDGVIYVVGGIGDAGVLATVEAYDPATDTWTTRAPMPTPRSHFRVAVVDGTLYAIGSRNESNPGIVEAYDPAADRWTLRASMPSPRYAFGIGTVNGIIYAVGGWDIMNDTPVATVNAYDPVSDTWTTRTPMAAAKSEPAVAAMNEILYVFGRDEDFHVDAAIEVDAYDPASDAWRRHSRIPGCCQIVTAGNNVIYASSISEGTYEYRP